MNARICVVTGATSGIGRATAVALVKLGAQVAAVGRNRRAGEALASRLARGETPGRMEFFRADLASFEEVRRTATELRRRIVTVGSGAHAASVGREWLLTQSTYDRKVACAVSKLANIMFSYELARRLHGTTVTANAVDPGEWHQT